jgi:hypothetical protein
MILTNERDKEERKFNTNEREKERKTLGCFLLMKRAGDGAVQAKCMLLCFLFLHCSM